MKLSDITPFAINSGVPELSTLNALASAQAFVDENIPSPLLIGFEPQLNDNNLFCVVVGEFAVMSITIQERIVSGNEIKTALKPLKKEFESRTGHPPIKSELQQIKEDLKTDLMRTANPVSSTVHVLIDRATERMYLSTRTTSRLDQITPFIRESLKLTLSNEVSKSNLTRLLTGFVREPSMIPENLTLGDRAVLFDSIAESSVTIRGDDLTSSEIVALLSSDKQVKSLQLRLEGKSSLIIHQDWKLQSLKVDLASLKDELGEDDSLVAQLQGSLFIYGHVIRDIYTRFQQEVDKLPE